MSSSEEDEERPCEQASASRDLPHGGGVRSVDVYGRQALLRLHGEPLFLSLFDAGWRVTAAGWLPEPGEQPYRCTLKGA
ncbi:hypothetical protein [Streptomyces flavochromogenes]|uniref:hypothetical protein n=1 Tax=Streptomyces flavochromogenes TaxID=68199 RepID=UPI00069165DD|nr:hypothetical protein [Streptomyces flavochromogenes]